MQTDTTLDRSDSDANAAWVDAVTAKFAVSTDCKSSCNLRRQTFEYLAPGDGLRPFDRHSACTTNRPLIGGGSSQANGRLVRPTVRCERQVLAKRMSGSV